MGISIGHNWSCGSSNDPCRAPGPLWDKNPDAKNFTLKEAVQLDRYLIVRVHYPNCINFEGNKIMVYRGITLKQFQGWTEVDPHFKNYGLTSPIARFQPSLEGWKDAIDFVNTKLKLDCIFGVKPVKYP